MRGGFNVPRNSNVRFVSVEAGLTRVFFSLSVMVRENKRQQQRRRKTKTAEWDIRRHHPVPPGRCPELQELNPAKDRQPTTDKGHNGSKRSCRRRNRESVL